MSKSIRLRTSSLFKAGFLLLRRARLNGEGLEFGEIDGRVGFDLNLLGQGAEPDQQPER